MPPEFVTPRADEYMEVLETRLPGKTHRHVQSVARLMLTFAEEVGITDEQAVTAGLLHDLCKPLKKEEMVARAKAFGITEDLDNLNLLHGPVGAETCRAELGVTDEAVLDAIRYHTTGRGDWNLVGCALYVADFAEPLRTIPEAKTARKILESKGYNEALIYIVNKRFQYARERFEPNENATAFVEWVNRITGRGSEK
jgi:predicted HD superfamily hydrolase involved in NAD metabolism